MGTLVGWLFLDEKETNTECRDTADFPTSESRFGTDSESEQSECEETRSYTERQRLANEEENKDRKEEEPAGGLADVLAGSGEVHGVLGVIVDLNRLGQCLGVPAITLTRHMAALGAVRQGQEGVTSRVVLVHK